MPTFRPTATWFWGLASALLLAAGCNLVGEPPADLFDKEVAPSVVSSHAAEIERTLAGAEWVIAPTAAKVDVTNASKPRSHWRHAGLEAVLSRDDARARLRRALRSTDASIAATAAIGLAWLEDEQVLGRLNEAARDSSQKLSARGAAIEAIGWLDTPDADDVLAGLVEELGQFQGPARARYAPELHADLVRVLARRDAKLHAEAIETALASPAAPVRLEATRAFLNGDRAPPRELVDRVVDDVASIRAAAIQALARAQHPEAQAAVQQGLNEYDLAVRLAAIEALGVLPAAENAAQLNELANSSVDVTRAAAVRALAHRGDAHAVIKAAGDESWRVRTAVAESLLQLSSAERFPVARALLGDASLEVQRRMVQALSKWPLDEAIPLLLAALEGKTAATRRQAAEQLQSVWPAAADLSPHASRETLAAEAARLREVWQRDYGAEVARRKESASSATSRPAVDPASADVMAVIERLSAESVHSRRVAARELALKHADSQLSEAALLRLRELVELETDTLVWNDVLEFIGHDGRTVAADLAAMAASHPSGDVRRRACSYFGRHPGRRAVEVLLNSLADEDPSVIREAVRSLGQQQALTDFASLEAILTSTDGELRLEAAAAIARLGSPQGLPALLRLTHHADPAIRRRAAVALGEIVSQQPSRHSMSDARRKEVIAELTRLLDDQGDVRRAAQASLQSLQKGTH